MRTVIVVNGEEYSVMHFDATQMFRQGAVAAVRAGGDLVRLNHDRGSLELLITSATTIQIYVSHPAETIIDLPPPVDLYDPYLE